MHIDEHDGRIKLGLVQLGVAHETNSRNLKILEKLVHGNPECRLLHWFRLILFDQIQDC